jgi:hypothetical protein
LMKPFVNAELKTETLSESETSNSNLWINLPLVVDSLAI